MSKRRNKNKKLNQDKIDLITYPPIVTTFTPEPEFPMFRYLTHYRIVEDYNTWSGKKTGKEYIRSKERTLQYKKSKDGDWYDIPEESSVTGPNDTGWRGYKSDFWVF